MSQLVRGRRVGYGLAPATVGLLAGGLALGPALGRGYVLRYDMVFVPDPPLSAAALGRGQGFPRAVPSDAVVAVLGRVLPGDIVQALLLLAVFVVAAAGTARLVPGTWLPAKLVAAVCYAWNPFVAERLLLGQWAVLLGYAGLPWVLCAAAGAARPRDLPRLLVALIPATIGGFSSVLLSGIVAGASAVARPARRAVPAVALVVGALVLVSLPWLVPALGSEARTDPAAVELFAARADTPFGTVGSLLTLGGIWNAQAVPAGYSHPFLATGRLALSVVAIAGWGWLLRRKALPDHGAGLSLAAGAGVGVALLGVTQPGRELLYGMIAFWPGFGPLRDGHLYVAPLALLQAVGLAGVAVWFRAAPSHGNGTRGARGAPHPGHTTTGAAGEPLTSSEADRPPAPPPPLQRLWTARPARASTRVATTAGVLLCLLPVAFLPGLAWGAGGRLAPVDYPSEWRAVQRIVDTDPAPGALLSLPWSAYRGLDWRGDGRTVVVLDPAIKLVRRPVVFNDDLRVGVGGETRTVHGEDPRAREVAPYLASGWPAEPAPATAWRLGELGIRYVLVARSAGEPPLDENTFRFADTGAEPAFTGTELVLLRIPDRHVRAESGQLSGLEVTGWLVTVGAILWSLSVSGSNLGFTPRRRPGAKPRKESPK